MCEGWDTGADSGLDTVAAADRPIVESAAMGCVVSENTGREV